MTFVAVRIDLKSNEKKKKSHFFLPFYRDWQSIVIRNTWQRCFGKSVTANRFNDFVYWRGREGGLYFLFSFFFCVQWVYVCLCILLCLTDDSFFRSKKKIVVVVVTHWHNILLHYLMIQCCNWLALISWGRKKKTQKKRICFSLLFLVALLVSNSNEYIHKGTHVVGFIFNSLECHFFLAPTKR